MTQPQSFLLGTVRPLGFLVVVITTILVLPSSSAEPAPLNAGNESRGDAEKTPGRGRFLPSHKDHNGDSSHET